MMRQKSYERLEKLYEEHCGYLKTPDLLKGGFTNRQIGWLVEEGYLERIANGTFWMMRCGKEKPADYKAVEACWVQPRAVIMADSACFYQGLIPVEPPRLSVATSRGDRSRMKLPFPVNRHYLSQMKYGEHLRKVSTPFGSYQIYDIDRSVCDCIRFRSSIEPEIFDLIMEQYRQEDVDQERKERLQQYANWMKIGKEAQRILG